MKTVNQRPVFLNLLMIQMPVTAVVSIGHRISGFVLFLSIPFFVYLLHLSLTGEAGFAATGEMMDCWLVRLPLLLVCWSVAHHLLAGLRFLLLDIDIGIERDAARRSAWITNLAALLLTVVIGGVIL